MNAAASIVGTVIEAMGDTAAESLSAYFHRASDRLQAKVSKQFLQHAKVDVVFDDQVRITTLDSPRTARRRHENEHTDTFDRALAYNGWKRNAYEYAWFDSSPEYKAAGATDAEGNVVVWARLHRNHIPITWTQEGREYNPDFVVVEEVDGKRLCWLVETKMNSQVTSAEVVAKKRAARAWSNTVNNSGQVDGRWQYLLLSEDDVNNAGGSWAQMKAFGH